MCEATFNGWSPIINACTLASYVMFVMKHEYIKNGDVGHVPENGYGGGNNSMLALKYIQWLEKKDPSLKLQYALRGGERQMKINGHNYLLDAYNPATDEVFEVLFQSFLVKCINFRFMDVFFMAPRSVSRSVTNQILFVATGPLRSHTMTQ